MCAVSMITDYYREKWPLPDYTKPLTNPNGVFITTDQWLEYLELKRRLSEYDKKTGQPDCVKPEVDEWEKKVIGILRKNGILK